MGKGSAQLGKAVKGKSKEKRSLKDKKAKFNEKLTQNSLNNDIQALEEYEKLNQLAEQQKKRLKEISITESQYSIINKQILQSMYRQFMRNEKIQYLKQEIEILSQNHIRDSTRSDEIMKSLLNELEETESQFQFATRNHLALLQKFNDLHANKLNTLEQEFQHDLKQIKTEFITERNTIINNHRFQYNELQYIIESIESNELERINESKQRHETEREEIRNKNLEGINELRINLENKIEDLERQFDDAHRNYVESTDSANEHFKRLKSEDAQLSLAIYEKKKKILKFQSLITSWKKKLELNVLECTERNNKLKLQKQHIENNSNELKLKMKKFRQNESKRLTELTLMARESLKNNQNTLQKAEKILTLAELARKLETEREKVLPFEYANININTLQQTNSVLGTVNVDSINTNKQESKEEKSSSIQNIYEFAPNLINTNTYINSNTNTNNPSINPTNNDNLPTAHNELANFYSRYNKVLLDKIAIETEKTRLQQENEDLKSILNQYLAGVSVKENVLDSENPLLIVNGKINLFEATLQKTQVKRVLKHPNITQEANLITNNYNKTYQIKQLAG